MNMQDFVRLFYITTQSRETTLKNTLTAKSLIDPKKPNQPVNHFLFDAQMSWVT